MILLCSHRRIAAPSSPSQFWWIQLVRLKWPSDYLNFPLKVILFWTLHVHCGKSWNQRRVWRRKQTFYIFFSNQQVRPMCGFSLCRFINWSCASFFSVSPTGEVGLFFRRLKCCPFYCICWAEWEATGTRDLTGTSRDFQSSHFFLSNFGWSLSSLRHAGLSCCHAWVSCVTEHML